MKYNNATKDLMERTIEYLLHGGDIPATRENIENDIFSDILQDKYNSVNDKKYKVFVKRVFEKLDKWKIIQKNEEDIYEFYPHLQPLQDWVNDERSYDSVTLSIAIIDAYYTVYEYNRDKEFVNDINSENEKLGPFTIAWINNSDNPIDEEEKLKNEIEKELFLSRNESEEWVERDTIILKNMCINTKAEDKLYTIRYELGKRKETILEKIKELNLDCKNIEAEKKKPISDDGIDYRNKEITELDLL